MSNLLNFPSTTAGAPGPASGTRDLPSDDAARQQALDTRASFIVEAPAGSGKTGLLLQRFLKLLADPDLTQPEEVLAITFTRKATAELRSRILTELEAAWAEQPLLDPNPFAAATRELAQSVLLRDHQLNWQLLQNPQRLRIRTIDSVCSEIANSLPLLSGSGAGRKAVEDANRLYSLAARRTLLHLGGPDDALNDALRTVLLHRDGSLADVENLLAKMLGNREQWAELIPLDPSALNDDTLERTVRPRLEHSLENIVCAGLTRATNALPAGALHELTHLAQRLSIEPGYQDSESPIAFCATLNEPPEARAEHLDHWLALIRLLLTKDGWRKPKGITSRNLGITLQPHHKTEISNLIEHLQSDHLLDCLRSVRDLPPAKYPDEQWHVAKALFHLLLHTLAELNVLFAETGECDFAEFALNARNALLSDTGASDLANSTGYGLRHLLVDEMQDTSSSQYDLIQLLTRHWDGHSQTLFLVGDPKQSIYLFRQARVERFLRTMREQRLGDLPLQPLQLTANFRSQASLVEGFNNSFSLIFPTPTNTISGEAIDVPFVAATASRTATIPEAICWHPKILDRNDPRAALTNTQQEARSIRQTIEAWHAKPLPANRTAPWKIAVLARTRRQLAPILAELQAADIPHRAVNVEALNDRPEVLDALALTRALLHPADRTAWLAVLHAPWCGLGLADLLALTGDNAARESALTIPSLFETRTALLSPEGQPLLHRVIPTLLTALETRGPTSLAVHIESTWRSLGGDASLQPNQLANVQHFFALLRELEQPGGWLDLRTLDTRLTQLFAESPAHPGAVDLMTIHSAKGLEWDVVLVPGLERRGQTSRSDLLNWLELEIGHETHVILAPIAGKGYDPDPLYLWLNKVRNARDEAERKRLYYVACTRAREELHLYAAIKPSAKDEINPPSGTLLASCWPAAAAHFAEVPIPAPDLAHSLLQSLLDEPALAEEPQPFALAASASNYPLLHRLPLSFDPLARFAVPPTLAYTPASALSHTPAFDRPEGSFAVRAFGNVVHRFLQVLANRLTTTPIDALLTELPTWQPRLEASLRGEGLAPTAAKSESSRALSALTVALTDPIGRWLLSPQPSAATEFALTSTTSTLRVDRTFLAASAPLIPGDTHLWIVDFKTTELGSRSLATFEADQRAKYTAQLETYATASHSDPAKPIMLALYYPLIPHLIHWPSTLSLSAG